VEALHTDVRRGRGALVHVRPQRSGPSILAPPPLESHGDRGQSRGQRGGGLKGVKASEWTRGTGLPEVQGGAGSGRWV